MGIKIITDEESEESQNKAIDEYLQEGHSIEPLEALKLFKCWSLAQRIYDLKHKPFNRTIHTEMVKYTATNGKIKRIARYWDMKHWNIELERRAEEKNKAENKS